MANYSMLPQRLLILIEGSGNGLEKGPKGSAVVTSVKEGHTPLEALHKSVPLVVNPDVATVVEQRPEHIDEKALEGTEATASPSTSHFEEMQPVSEKVLKKHAGPLRQLWEYLFTRPEGEIWYIEKQVKEYRQKEHRKTHPEENLSPPEQKEEV